MPLSAGQLLNSRYRIVKLIGQGGFGAVYRAWDTALNQPCAVKENLDISPEAQRQFQREATTLAGLRHPNLPRVTDHFLIPGQGQYLVMDFIEGQSLADLASQHGRPLAEAEVLPWLEQVCSALDYLHSQHPPIIHRDIKPQNIIVTPAGAAMLVDFGISKAYDPQHSTTVGARSVTPGFSPPEQYGTGGTDSRSDIYSLGATLYTLFTGQAPCDAIDRLTRSVSVPSLSSRRPDLLPGLCRMVDGALELSPAARPRSVAEMWRMVCESGIYTVATRQPQPPARVLSRRLPAWVWGASAAGLLLAGLLGWQLVRALMAPARAPNTAEKATQVAPFVTSESPSGAGGNGEPTTSLAAGMVTATTATDASVTAPSPGRTNTAGLVGAPAEVEETTRAAPGPKVLKLNMGPGDIPTIDPALAEDTSSIQISLLAFGGLSFQNEVTSGIEPGLATAWTISDDGLIYTFKLRDDVPWVKYNSTTGTVETVKDCAGNVRKVTADDFVYGILRSLNPSTASPYAYILAFVIKGAAEYNSGTVTDPSTVGVKALDSTTLRVTFKEAVAHNTVITSMWPAFAQPKWLIEGDDCTEARRDRWVETGWFQGYGPYTLKEWFHSSRIRLIKNPFWPGTDAIPAAKIEEVTWSMLDEESAFGEYEAGRLDVAAVPLADLDRIKADPKLSTELTVKPQLCTYYYGFNTKAPIVNDARVRRALSMAIDRQRLIDNVLRGGQIPAQWFARPGSAGAPTLEKYPDLGIKYDPAEAKAELDSYLREKGLTADKLALTLVFNTSVAGHQRIAEAIQQMWKANLGLGVKLAGREDWAEYLKSVRDPVATPQIWRLGWCIDYPDANNWDRDVVGFGGEENPKDGGGLNWRNDAYEKLIGQASRELDAEKRTALYAKAEDILVNKDAVMAPIYWYTLLRVTKPYVERTFSVLGDREAINKWDIRK